MKKHKDLIIFFLYCFQCQTLKFQLLSNITSECIVSEASAEKYKKNTVAMPWAMDGDIHLLLAGP